MDPEISVVFFPFDLHDLSVYLVRFSSCWVCVGSPDAFIRFFCVCVCLVVRRRMIIPALYCVSSLCKTVRIKWGELRSPGNPNESFSG